MADINITELIDIYLLKYYDELIKEYINNKLSKLDGIDIEHLHEIIDVNGLQDILDSKVANTLKINGKTLTSNITMSANDVGADASGTASTLVSNHNTSTTSHNDIRDLIAELTDRLNTLADSDDTTLDQMSEIVAYIKANKTLIDSVTTNKINVSDIVNNLTTNVSTKPLSAAQGVTIKELIDALQTEVNLKTNSSVQKSANQY